MYDWIANSNSRPISVGRLPWLRILNMFNRGSRPTFTKLAVKSADFTVESANSNNSVGTGL